MPSLPYAKESTAAKQTGKCIGAIEEPSNIGDGLPTAVSTHGHGFDSISSLGWAEMVPNAGEDSNDPITDQMLFALPGIARLPTDYSTQTLDQFSSLFSSGDTDVVTGTTSDPSGDGRLRCKGKSCKEKVQPEMNYSQRQMPKGSGSNDNDHNNNKNDKKRKNNTLKGNKSKVKATQCSVNVMAKRETDTAYVKFEIPSTDSVDYIKKEVKSLLDLGENSFKMIYEDSSGNPIYMERDWNLQDALKKNSKDIILRIE